MINKETGNRLKQQMVDAETGDVVESDQKGRGYELKKGEYVEIEKEELEAVQIESNHTIDIDSFVPQGRDRQALSQPPLLHRARRQGRHRRLRGDPRRHEGPGPRRAGAHRADQPRAHHRDRAARQGPARHHAALSLRTARRGRVFRRHQEPEDLEGHGRTRRPHPRHQGRAFRSLEIQGRIRERAEDAGQAQGRRQAGQGRRAGGEAGQRHQPDGCAEAEPEGTALRPKRPLADAADGPIAPPRRRTARRRERARRGKTDSLYVIASERSTSQRFFPPARRPWIARASPAQ